MVLVVPAAHETPAVGEVIVMDGGGGPVMVKLELVAVQGVVA